MCKKSFKKDDVAKTCKLQKCSGCEICKYYEIDEQSNVTAVDEYLEDEGKYVDEYNENISSSFPSWIEGGFNSDKRIALENYINGKNKKVCTRTCDHNWKGGFLKKNKMKGRDKCEKACVKNKQCSAVTWQQGTCKQFSSDAVPQGKLHLKGAICEVKSNPCLPLRLVKNEKYGTPYYGQYGTYCRLEKGLDHYLDVSHPVFGRELTGLDRTELEELMIDFADKNAIEIFFPIVAFDSEDEDAFAGIFWGFVSVFADRTNLIEARPGCKGLEDCDLAEISRGPWFTPKVGDNCELD